MKFKNYITISMALDALKLPKVSRTSVYHLIDSRGIETHKIGRCLLINRHQFINATGKVPERFPKHIGMLDINDDVTTVPYVQELFGCTRRNVHMLIKSGKLETISLNKWGSGNLILAKSVEAELKRREKNGT